MPHFRALPWVNTAELAQLYAWIWDDPEDTRSTERAVARLSTYLQSPSQPLFIPLLHSLLTALLLPLPQTSTETLISRLTLGAALTRFINSLVDPLQQRTYARPITSIAKELGLPEGLVGLRHAVTHEDLPGLSVLRGGAGKAVEWIRREVMGPVIWGSGSGLSGTGKEGWEGEEEFKDLLARYKKLIKSYYRQRTTARSVSVSVGGTGGWQGARELRIVMRQVEDLVDGPLEAEKGDEGREKVARCVARVLLGRQGGIVPSLRKRQRYDPARPDDFPYPTTAILRIWTPLLSLLCDKFTPTDSDDDADDDDDSTFPELFASECAAIIRETIASRPSDTPTSQHEAEEQQHEADYWLVPSAADDEPSARDIKSEETSYLATLASWLVYTLSAPRPAGAEGKKRKRAEEEESVLQMEVGARGKVVRGLLEGCGVRVVADAVRCYQGATADGSSAPNMAHVLSALMKVDETSRNVISQLAGTNPSADPLTDDPSQTLENRLALFRKMMAARTEVVQGEQEQVGVEVMGWVKLGPASGWKECPIGYWRD